MLPANSRHRAAVAQSTALNSWVSSLPTPGPYLQGTWWDVTSEQWSGTLPTRPVCLMAKDVKQVRSSTEAAATSRQLSEPSLTCTCQTVEMVVS